MKVFNYSFNIKAMNRFLLALVLVVVLIILFVYSFNSPLNAPQVVVPQTQNIINQGTTSTSSVQSSTSTNTVSTTTSQISVSINNFSFVPASEVVKLGTVIVWTNNDSVPHTVNGGSVFSSAVLQPGDTFSFTFNRLGTFNYTCSIHPSMKGQIIVQ